MDVEGQSGFNPGAAWLRMWTDWTATMMGAGAGQPPFDFSGDAARRVRTQALKAWGEYCEQFMRSPEFLEGMRQSLSGSLDCRKQLNNMFGEMLHAMQGATSQDVDEIMRTLHHLEQGVSEGIERISARLDELSIRLQRLEQNRAASSPGCDDTSPSNRLAHDDLPRNDLSRDNLYGASINDMPRNDLSRNGDGPHTHHERKAGADYESQR